MKRWIVLCFLIPVLSCASALAQTSAYEDQLVENLSLIRSWQSYLFDFPSKPNLAPPQDVDALAKAVAQVYAAFHDDHVSEHEAALKDEFERMVVAGFVSQYPVVRERLAKTRELLAAGRAADPAAYDFRLDRLREMVQWHYFALPLLLYQGKTPYNDMYADALAQHAAVGQPRPALDLVKVKWPSVSSADLGSTEVVSISEQRRRDEAARDAKQAALAAEIERDNAARRDAIAEQVAAAQAAAQAEVAEELARAQQAVANAQVDGQAGAMGNEKDSGFGLGWLVVLLALGALGFVAFQRGWIPAAVADRTREVARATQKLTPLNLKDKE